MEDTIASIATPVGKGGIAIVRISGPDAHRCLDRVFHKSGMEMRKMYYGGVYDGTVLLDKCLCVKFDQNASYTGEFCAEIQCHGGYAVAKDILQAVYKAGARSAGRGEFTKRAFLNGRIDLSQAEAVGDMIEAESIGASRAAARLLSGELWKRIQAFQNTIMELLTSIEAGIDYPDEIDEQETNDSIRRAVTEMLPQIRALIQGYQRGRIAKEGLQVCLIGKPNAGKSSLLNALCGFDRAIVTDIPGTTRDTLHESLELAGIRVSLWDTAGIRESDDLIEQAGVKRSVMAAEQSDMILCVIDSTDPAPCKDMDFSKLCTKPGLFVINKTDLQKDPAAALPDFWKTIRVSAKEGFGMDSLLAELEAFAKENDPSASLTVLSERHYEALKNAERNLTDVLDSSMPPDILSVDLTAAWQYLGEITGQTATEDIVNHIFEKFCVGK